MCCTIKAPWMGLQRRDEEEHYNHPLWADNDPLWVEPCSVIFVNENENENGEKRENNEFVNEN